jgi:hypothetical protein
MNKTRERKKYGTALALRLERGDLVELVLKGRANAKSGRRAIVNVETAIVLKTPQKSSDGTFLLLLSSRVSPRSGAVEKNGEYLGHFMGVGSTLCLREGFDGFCRLIPAREMVPLIKTMKSELMSF